LLFTKEFLIDILSRDEVRDLLLDVELVDVVEVGDGEGDETLARGDKLDTDTLSFPPCPFRSTELDRLLRANLSILKQFFLSSILFKKPRNMFYCFSQ
jgi:hypothetical protein